MVADFFGNFDQFDFPGQFKQRKPQLLGQLDHLGRCGGDIGTDVQNQAGDFALGAGFDDPW